VSILIGAVSHGGYPYMVFFHAVDTDNKYVEQ